MNKTRRNTILLCAVVLRIFVVATFVALATRLNLFLQDADGAISLTGEDMRYSYGIPEGEIIYDFDIAQNTAPQGEGSAFGVEKMTLALGKNSVETQQTEILETPAVMLNAVNDSITTSAELCQTDYAIPTLKGTGSWARNDTFDAQPTTMILTQPPRPTNMYNPGFAVKDDVQTWSTNTQIDIFKVTYENGDGEITVRSDNGDKVFAPGTDNSYTFKLINTGDVTLEYGLEVRAYFTPDNIDLPIDARLNRYDGKWLSPEEGAFVDVLLLDGLTDTDRLGAGKYTYYTIDWRWLFESGHDDIDTMLGNMAVDQDLALTIEINTIAMATEEPGGGITVPDTSDNTNTILWMCLGFGSTLLIVLLVYYKKSVKDEE